MATNGRLSPAERRGLILAYLKGDEPTTARVVWVFVFRGHQRDRECSLPTVKKDLEILASAGLVQRVANSYPVRWQPT